MSQILYKQGSETYKFTTLSPKKRAQRTIDDMVKEGIMEEHPVDEPVPCVSNVVSAPKTDGQLRINLDSRNVTKTIETTNMPIPRHKNIKAKVEGCRVFSKLDFKSAFRQIRLAKQSRCVTFFHANDE